MPQSDTCQAKRSLKILTPALFALFMACQPVAEAADASSGDSETMDSGSMDSRSGDVSTSDSATQDSNAADSSANDSAPRDTARADANRPDQISPDQNPADASQPDNAVPADSSIDDRALADVSGVDPGTDLGLVQLTYYWISDEDDFDCASPDTDLRTCDGTLIATVCANFAESARMEGTAHLSDGRGINIGGCSCSGGFSCFALLDADHPWGVGSHDNALQPFVSVATDTSFIPYGSRLYSPDIRGLPIPEALGGGLHDGCLTAADVGGGINGAHIDFFVGRKLWYQQSDPLLPENIRLYRAPANALCP